MAEDQAIIPAATVVVMRERAHGAPEVLMLERSTAMAFAGGALVFPGGRIDPGDHALANLIGGGDETAAKIAAVRETIEESGIALALDPPPDQTTLQAIRAALHEGVSLAQAMDAAGIALALDRLEVFARWLPSGVRHRIFDTRFFLALAPRDAEPTVDATENTRLFWATPQSVLDDADAGRVTIIFPTRRNLERLARYGSFADAVDDARAHPVRTITPWIEERDGIQHLCIPEDLGYPVLSEPMKDARRA